MLVVPATKETYKAIKHYNYLQKNTEICITPVIINDDVLHFPRNLAKLEGLLNTKLKIIDKTVEAPVHKPITLSPTFCLREHQIEPMTTLVNNFKVVTEQILVGETGFGKTYCLPYILAELQQRTLILVDRTLLAEQMLKEIQQNCDADVQILDKNSDRIADVNIATLQLLMRNSELVDRLSTNIGLVILDECHICGAERIKSIVQFFPAKYRLGLSATPTRSDGLTEILTDVFGDTKVIAEALGALRPTVVVVWNKDCRFNVRSLKHFKKDLAKFLQLPIISERIQEFVKKIVKLGRQVLIATDIVEVQEHYAKLLNNLGIKTAIINANTKKSERHSILESFNNEETKVLVSFSVLEKGISIPRLDTIIHLSGGYTKERLTQLIGRSRRADERKRSPIFVDMLFAGDTYTTNNTRIRTYAQLHKENKIEKIVEIQSWENFKTKF